MRRFAPDNPKVPLLKTDPLTVWTIRLALGLAAVSLILNGSMNLRATVERRPANVDTVIGQHSPPQDSDGAPSRSRGMGQSMPWPVAGIHRSLAAFSLLLAIGLLALAIYGGRGPWITWISAAALVLAIIQALLLDLAVFDGRRVAGQTGQWANAGVLILATVLAQFHHGGDRTDRANEPPKNYRRLLQGTSVSILLLCLALFVSGFCIANVNPASSSRFLSGWVRVHLAFSGALVILSLGNFLLSRFRLGRIWGSRGTSIFLVILVLIEMFIGAANWILQFGWPAWLEGSFSTAHFVIDDNGPLQTSSKIAHTAIHSLILMASCVLVLRSCRIDRVVPDNRCDAAMER